MNFNLKGKIMEIPVFPSVEALIFDCDGTLADTMPLHEIAWEKVFVNQGLEYPGEYLNSLKGTATRQIIVKVNEKYGYNLDPDVASHQQDVFAFESLAHAKPIAPVEAVVKKYAGRLPMAVGSGGRAKSVRRTLTAIGLREHFSAIVTSEDVVNHKPAPDTFLRAAELLNVPPEKCQVFEDGDVGLEAARAAGMMATDIRLFL
jgi:beta-phosphoglucomutase family hydrolase